MVTAAGGTRARILHTHFLCSRPRASFAPQGFQSFSDQVRFRILLLSTENSNPDIMGMYLLSDSWPRFASPSGSCGAEHPVFRGKKFCSSASAM
jgi:hypothetical protein